VPQLVVVVCRLMHVPEQFDVCPVQHTPPPQVPPHGLLQPPQWLVLVLVSTQAPPQLVCPGLQHPPPNVPSQFASSLGLHPSAAAA
jgi:hypothetical protein